MSFASDPTAESKSTDEVVTARTTQKVGDDASCEATNVKVMVRVRPFSAKEVCEEETPTSVIFMDDSNRRVVVLDPSKEYAEREAFEFDQTFWSIPDEQNQYTTKKEISDQSNVFDRTGKVAVDAALEAYNATIFAYGQTGSGKTHTMFGTVGDPGITLRLLEYIFKRLDEKEQESRDNMSTSTRSYSATVELSFLEIYNEKVRDLLVDSLGGNAPQPTGRPRSSTISAGHLKSPAMRPRAHSRAGMEEGGSDNETDKPQRYTECRVRYTPSTGTYVDGLKRETVTNIEQCTTLLTTGMEHRSVAATKMNDTSSRSHAVLQLCVKQKDALRGTLRVSLINLVDLAGSERIRMSGAQGSVLTEAKNINLSLSTLRRVIDILIENATKRNKAVPPYRESMLTWLLSDSLGGNSRTTMMATVSPAKSNLEDSINTLRYATKAKAIVCSVHVNEQKTAVVVGALKAEMEDLRRKLQTNAAEQSFEAQRAIREELDKREEEWRQAVEEHHALESQGARLRNEIDRVEAELTERRQVLDSKKEVAEDVRRMDEEARQALEQLSVHERAINTSIAERAARDDEISNLSRLREEMSFREKEATQAMVRISLEERELSQKMFAGIFRGALGIATDRKEINYMRQSVDVTRDKLKRVEANHAQVMEKFKVADNEKRSLYQFVTGYEDRLAKKTKEFEMYMDNHAREEAALRTQLEEIQHKTHTTSNDTFDTVQKIEAARAAHNAFLMQEEETAIIARTTAAISEVERIGGEIELVLPRVEELRERVPALTEKHQSLLPELEKLENERDSLSSLQSRYDDRLSELVADVRDIENELADKEKELVAEKETYNNLRQQKAGVRRAHQGLKGFVTRKCFAHQTTQLQSSDRLEGSYRSPRDSACTPSNASFGRTFSMSMAPSEGPTEVLGAEPAAHVSKFVRYNSYDRSVAPNMAYQARKRGSSAQVGQTRLRSSQYAK
eukprot:PhM_4_TR3010/c0_g1_i1/m.89495/K17914/KIF13; kinesin family member 13